LISSFILFFFQIKEVYGKKQVKASVLLLWTYHIITTLHECVCVCVCMSVFK